jgi:penicillin-binding protein 1A
MLLTLRLLVLALVAAVVPLGCVLWKYSRDLPSYEQLATYKPLQITRIYSSDLKLIGECGPEKRTFVPIDSISALVRGAFVAAEDGNFYKHCGIDTTGIFRASIKALPSWIKGKPVKGASTITQQVVKNLLLSSERTMERKIKEILLSLLLSRKFSKDQVLELYLNHVYFGRGAYGIASAARTYFDKSIDELELAEVAFLAGTLSAPSSCDPVRNYPRAKFRRSYVLYRMYENNLISRAQLDEALSTEIALKQQEHSSRVYAPYYLDRIQDLAMQIVGKEALYVGGLTIVTSIDSVLQEKANKAFVEGLREYDQRLPYRGPIAHIFKEDWKSEVSRLEKRFASRELKVGVILANSQGCFLVGLADGRTAKLEFGPFKSSARGLRTGDAVLLLKSGNTCTLTQIPECNGALMAMRPASGRVVAMVGGYDYLASQFDRATQAKRQIGSLVKVFVYLTALENNVEPSTIFPDEPIEVPIAGQGVWSPRNNRNIFLGPVTMRTAFEKSCNSVTVRLAQQLGMEQVVSTLKRFGISQDIAPNPSVVLGAVETSLARVVNACSMLVNGGYRVKPCFIEYIQDSKGRILYRAPDACSMEVTEDGIEFAAFDPEPERVVDEASAYQITSLMVGAAKRGTARTLGSVTSHVVGGKTGTTNGCCDAWFVGFSSDIVAGCYVGHDNPKSLGVYEAGATVALPPVRAFLSKALSNKTPSHPKIPSNIRFETINPATGELAEEGFGIIEAFKIKPNYDASYSREVKSDDDPSEMLKDLKILDIDEEEGND